MFCKKSALRKVSAKFTGKGLCQRLYFNKVAFLSCKKETLAQVLSREFSKISKNTFFTEHLRTTVSALSFSEAATGRCSMKKGVLGNCTKFTGKHLWFAKFSETPFLQNIPGRLLLAFSCNVTKMGYCQQSLKKLR